MSVINSEKFLRTLLPVPDKVVVIKITGKTFKEALENGVSEYPTFDGRWPCVSGVTFKFDPRMPKKERI